MKGLMTEKQRQTEVRKLNALESDEVIRKAKDQLVIFDTLDEVCYGGIGIHGHVAFNEPEPGVKDSNPRILKNLRIVSDRNTLAKPKFNI